MLRRMLNRSTVRRSVGRVRASMPNSVQNRLRLFQGIVNLSRIEQHECNLCGFAGRFWPFGNPPRRGAQCGNCGSLERHRLVGLWLDANAAIVSDSRVLHFAPEPILSRLLRQRSKHYLSADLNPQAADVGMDIENIDLPNGSVDLVVCCHILEHVDDRKALNEIARILAPDGLALFMFPIVEGWRDTYENPAHTSSTDRIKYFGQSDHVRMFGGDVRQRICDAGFALTELTAEEPNVARYGLVRGEKVFIAAKGA
jgi:SAM-dependent methyltransferase